MPSHSAARCVDEHAQDLTDRSLARDRIPQGQVPLHLVSIPPTVLALHYVAGVGQIGDDPVRRSLGDVQFRRDVAQSDVGVMGDAQQHSTMVRQEPPLPRHDDSRTFMETDC